MEPNKLETQIREQLNAREIKPSEMAWDRLDAMLSVAEEKKTKRSFGWWYIAASILVFVTAGLFFYNQKSTEIQINNTVVVKETSKDSVKANPISTKNNVTEDLIQVQEKQPLVQVENIKKEEKSLSSSNHNNQKTTVNPLLNPNKEIEYQNSEVIAQKDLPKVMPQEKTVVSKSNEVNVDELLASVDKSSKSDKKIPIKVNVNSLLSQVDVELEMTFKQKVINKLGKNYEDAKIALAKRNQESNTNNSETKNKKY